MVIWRDRLFNKIKDKVLRAVLELITKDRDGEQINQSEVRGVIESYGAPLRTPSPVAPTYRCPLPIVKLGVINKNKPLEIYKEDFETPFLAATRELNF